MENYNYKASLNCASVPIYKAINKNSEIYYMSQKQKDLYDNSDEDICQVYICQYPISNLLDEIEIYKKDIIEIKQIRDLNKEFLEACKIANKYDKEIVSQYIFNCGKCGGYSPFFNIRDNNNNIVATDICCNCEKEKFNNLEKELEKEFLKKAYNVFN